LAEAEGIERKAKERKEETESLLEASKSQPKIRKLRHLRKPFLRFVAHLVSQNQLQVRDMLPKLIPLQSAKLPRSGEHRTNRREDAAPSEGEDSCSSGTIKEANAKIGEEIQSKDAAIATLENQLQHFGQQLASQRKRPRHRNVRTRNQPPRLPKK
jgi:hypothetical protein